MSHKDVFAIYDISSSSVAGAHALRHDGAVTLLASTRHDVQFQEDLNIKRFVEDTTKNLEDTISAVCKVDVHQPSYVQVVLASPWYSSQTRVIAYQRDTAFTCTHKLIDKLIDAEIKHILSQQDGPFGPYGKESVIVEKQISTIKLNGYVTEHPFGKKAHSVECSLTITIAPKEILDTFSDTLKRAYGTRKIGFTTSAFTTFIVMRDVLPVSEECVVIDVGEEVTDVAFVKGGTILYQHSFPVGTYGLYRTLSGQNAHTSTESLALLESYRLGKLSKSATTSVQKAISAYTKDWQSAFQRILEDGHYGFCMPQQVILVADQRFEALFTTILETDPFIEHACARGKVVVTFMAPDKLPEPVHAADQSTVDTPLAIGALFVNRLL